MASLNLGTLTAGLALDSKEFTKGVSGATKSMQGLGAMLGSALSLGAVVAGLNKATDAASDLSETANLIGVTFGGLAPEVVKTTTLMSKEVGRSRKAMLEYVASLGALIKPLTGSQKAASEMSPVLAQLAVDMGSFFNAADEDVLLALRSGLTGEMEPLKRFGIAMSVANLQAFALSQGIGKSVSKMSEAEKVTLRYNFILAKTKDAQGDAARTADGLANKTKRFAGTIEDAVAEIGAIFVPVKQLILDAGLGALKFWNALSPATKAAAVLGSVVGVLALGLTAAAVAFAPFIAGLFSALIPLGALALGVAGIVLLVGALKMAWDENLGGIREITASVLGFLVQSWEALLTVVDFVATAARDQWIDSVGAILIAYQHMSAGVKGALNVVQLLWQKAMDWIKKPVAQALAFISEGWAFVGDVVSRVATTIREHIVAAVNPIIEAFNKLKGLAISLFATVEEAAAKTGKRAITSLSTEVSALGSRVGATKKTLLGLAGAAAAFNAKTFGGPQKEAAKAIAKIKATMEAMKKTSVGEDMKGAFKDALDFLKTEGPGIAGAVGDALKDALGAAFDLLPQEVKDFLSQLSGGLDEGLDVGTGAGGGTGGAAAGAGGGPGKSVSAALGEAGQVILEGSGKLSSLVNSAVQGFETGGPIGALIALGTQLLMMSGNAEILFSALDGIIQTVADTLGILLVGLKPILGTVSILVDAVLKPLEPALKEVGNILESIAPLLVLFAGFLRVFMIQFTLMAPLLKAIMPLLDVVFRGFFLAMKIFGLGVLGIAVMIADVIDWVVGGIGKIVGGILNFVAGIIDFIVKILPGKNQGLKDTAAALRGAAESAKEWGVGADALREEFQKMKDLTFDGAADLAVGAFEDLADGANGATAALTNIPSGFKVARARFDAIEGQLPTATAAGGTAGQQGGVEALAFYFDTLNVNADDPVSLAEKMKDLRESAAGVQSGSVISPRGLV